MKGFYVPGEGDITELVLEEYQKGHYMQAVRGAELQKRVAWAVGAQKVGKFGRPILNVHEDVYYHWVNREGQACWGDAGFRKDLLRDNESMRPRIQKNMSRVSFAGAYSAGDCGVYGGLKPVKGKFKKAYS